MRTLRCVETWGFDCPFMPYLIPQGLNHQPHRCGNLRTGKVKWHSPSPPVFSNGCSSRVRDSWQITVTEHMSAYWTTSFGETTHRRQQILGGNNWSTATEIIYYFKENGMSRVPQGKYRYFVICYLFYIFRHIRRIAKSDYWLRHVCSSVRPSTSMEQLGSHWTDFHEVWYLSIFRKFVDEIAVSLKSVKNNWYFTGRSIHVYNTGLFISPWNILKIRNK